MFDPTTAELINGDQKIHLQNQVAKVLILLIEANGQVISKKELLNQAWQGAIVTENSLDKTISELRKVFSDSRTHPEFIETLPKKGYRFIAPLKKIEREVSSISIIKKRSTITLVLLTVLSVLLTIVYFVTFNSSSKKVLSPDGKMIASIKKDNTLHALFLENITNGKIQKLDSFAKPESIVLQWSSDNQNIIYNTSLAKNDFYALTIFNIQTNKKSYIKFPKKEGTTISNPNRNDSLSKFLEHKKLSKSSNTIHYITYTNNDTIKVLFNNQIISDFKW